MSIAQLYVSPDHGQTWVPWDGGTPSGGGGDVVAPHGIFSSPSQPGVTITQPNDTKNAGMEFQTQAGSVFIGEGAAKTFGISETEDLVTNPIATFAMSGVAINARVVAPSMIVVGNVDAGSFSTSGAFTAGGFNTAGNVNAAKGIFSSTVSAAGATLTGALNGTTGSFSGALSAASFNGTASSASKLTPGATINGVAFDGSFGITVQDATKLPLGGTAAAASKLSPGATINGVAFDGTGPITVADATKLPVGGTAAAASKLSPGHAINGVQFDGTVDITVADATKLPLHATADAATKLATARLINGVSFDGTADITVADATKLPVGGTAAAASKLSPGRNINGVAFDGTTDITVADATKLPLAGGTLTGNLSGTTAAFSGQVNALNVILPAGGKFGWGSGAGTYISGDNNTAVISMQGAAVRLLGCPYAILGVRDGGAYGGTGPNASYDAFVIESNAATGMSFLTPNNVSAGINWDDSDAQGRGYVLYNHNVDQIQIGAAGATSLILDAAYTRSTQPFVAPDGSAASPSIGFTAQNWGLFRVPGVGVGVSVTNVEVARFSVAAFILPAATDAVLQVTTPPISVASMGWRGEPMLSITTGTYTMGSADCGRGIYHTAAAVTFTVLAGSTVPIGTKLYFYNDIGAGIITISGADTFWLLGGTAATSRSLAANGYAKFTKVAATRWACSGVGLT